MMLHILSISKEDMLLVIEPNTFNKNSFIHMSLKKSGEIEV